jgi:cytidylate kinase
MAIITISRGSYSMGVIVAEKVAQRLGYAVISRDLLLDASDRFHIPEFKLIRAIHDAPGILERFSHNKQAYLAYIRAALTERASSDNVVYHGLAGHILLKNIQGVLKVRITADMEYRVAREMKREGISEKEARSILEKDDQQRRKWTKNLHGADPWDSNLYDLVIRIDRFKADDAVDFICQAAESQAFRTTEESLEKIRDMALACRVKAELVDEFHNIGVTCHFGNVVVYTKEKSRGAKLHRQVEAVRKTVGGIYNLYNLEIHSAAGFPPDAV